MIYTLLLYFCKLILIYHIIFMIIIFIVRYEAKSCSNSFDRRGALTSGPKDLLNFFFLKFDQKLKIMVLVCNWINCGATSTEGFVCGGPRFALVRELRLAFCSHMYDIGTAMWVRASVSGWASTHTFERAP